MNTVKKKKRTAVINQNICVACGACAGACPRGAISVWKGCYARPAQELCVGCGLCAKTCPAGCISIKERSENN